MSKYVLTESADRDLDAIWRYVAEQGSPQAADRLELELHKTMLRLAASPGMGHVRDDLADETLRVFPKGKYLVIYLSDLDPIHIVRVLHSARDIAAVVAMPTFE